MSDISYQGYGEASQVASMLLDRENVEQPLCGMFVRTIAGIDDGAVNIL